MAFDFLSYMVQQAEQQPSLFADETKLQRQQSLTHLMALQLAALIQIAERHPQQLPQMIEQLEHDKVSEQVLKYLLDNETSVQFFDTQAIKLRSTLDLSGQLLLSELKQLSHNAGFAEKELQDLLAGQYPWMQAQVQNWFWDCIGHPEYKLSDDPLSQSDEQEESIQMSHSSHADLDIKLEQDEVFPEPAKLNRLYLLISPLIALVIIIFLFKSVF